jgi:5'-nucleotidase (lipoprotein e(P4) family)
MICRFVFTFVVLFFCVERVWSQDSTSVQSVDPKLLAVLWQQHSSEYRALCYQAFNVASERLDEMKLKRRERYAIITDIDETLLDNSYYEATRIKQKDDFNPVAWKVWTDKSAAPPLPGAVDFFRKAKSKKISIFYISNRNVNEVESTVENLKRLHLPDADTAHMLFLKDTSSKESRRQAVLNNYKVIMLLGDNLNDFAIVFEKKSNLERHKAVDSLRSEWGLKFIVLPNAVYGEWENALYGYRRGLSLPDKATILNESLITTPLNK